MGETATATIEPSEGLPYERHVLLGLGSLAYAALLFVWFSLPAYVDEIIVDLDLSGAQAGVLEGAVPLTYIPLALVTGLVVDRLGPLRTMGVGIVLFGIAETLRAGAGGFASMLVFTVLLGVGGTTITFGLPKLVAELYPAAQGGSASAVYLLGSYAGTAAAFALGRSILGPLLGGWRPLFYWSGLAVLGFAVIWWAVTFLAASTGTDVEQTFDPGSLRSDVATVFASRSMWLVVALGTAYLLLVHGIQGWAATILQSRGIAAGLAAGVTSAFVVAQAVGTVSLPTVSDYLGRRRGVIVASGVFILLGTTALAVTGRSVLAAVGAVALVGVGVGGVSPLVRVLPVEIEGIGSDLTGVAVGLVFAVGEAGGFLGPVLVGTMYDVTGSYVPGIGILAASGLVVVSAGLALDA